MKLFWFCSILLLLLGLFYLPVLRDLVYVWWSDPNYSHGFLVPFITGFLLWNRKTTLGIVTIRPSAWGSLILALGLVLCFVGEAATMAGGERAPLFIKGLSLILVLAGLILLLLGPDFLKLSVFPLTYLVFMLPLPETLLTVVTMPLQDYTTRVTTSSLQLLSVPALREGNLIHLSSVTLGIVEACSGIRSLMTLLAGAVALSDLTLKQWWQRLILISSVVPIAILTNAGRVTGTGLLTHFGGAAVAQSFFHGFSGWGVLIVAAMLLCAEILLLTQFPGEGERSRA
jgi:exosortase